jgi:hypothetical protein
MSISQKNSFQKAKEVLNVAEAKRSKWSGLGIILYILSIIMFIAAFALPAYALIEKIEEPDYYLYIAIACGIGSFLVRGGIRYGLYWNLQKYFTEEVRPALAQLYLENQKVIDEYWENAKGFFEGRKVFKKFVSAMTSHLIEGTMEGNKVRLGEFKLTIPGKSSSSSGNRNESIKFQGLFLYSEISQKIPSSFYLIPGTRNPKRKFERLDNDQLKEVDMKSLNTLSKYSLLAEYQEFVNQLLPSINQKVEMMEKVLRENKITKKPLRMAFEDYGVFIAIETKKPLFKLPDYPLLNKINTDQFLEKQTRPLEVLAELTKMI